MFFFGRIPLPTLVVFLASCIDLVTADSAPARPIRRLAHPSTLALEILPRQPLKPDILAARSLPLPSKSTVLRHSDSFRLTLTAFERSFHLHLRPNDALIHPAARITYVNTAPDGTRTTHSEPLLRESVKAYWGEVVPAHVSPARMRADAAGALPSSADTLGWARIVVHHQGDARQNLAPVFEGAFSVSGVVHHVMTKDNYLRTKHPLDPALADDVDELDSSLVVWRDSDFMSPEEESAARGGTYVHVSAQAQTCGHDQLQLNAENDLLQKPMAKPWYDPFSSGLGLFPRDDVVSGTGNMTYNFADDIGNTSGCPKTQKVLYMGVAADCEYSQAYGNSSNATVNIINNWNKAGALYKSTFNVSLGIVELQIHNASCPTTPDPTALWNQDCNNNITLNDRLSLFSQWRGQKGNDGAGLWHLMSGCPTGDEVGIAWLGTLCSQTATQSGGAFVSGAAVSTAGKTEWQVISHEIGHNFGAIHDCADGCNSTSSCCPLSSSSCDANSKFIMSPVADAGEMQFSQCSLGNICSVMSVAISGAAQLNTTCLIDAADARTTISLQMCGNGIVEAGEDCDPGRGVNSTCCDSTTCKFTAGATCDPASSVCCTASCGFAPATQVCRPSRDSTCDTAETCTGSSADCPADVTAANGLSCGSGLACASGTCTSNSLQCQNTGASMGLTTACSQPGDTSCQVSCQDPKNSRQCIILQSALIDGSSCGYGGRCTKGRCQSGTLLETAKSFYTSNLQISIPVTVVAGIILLLLVYALFLSCRRCCLGDPRDFGSEQMVQKDPNVSFAPVVTSVQSSPLQGGSQASSRNSSFRGETRADGNWERFDSGPGTTYGGWQQQESRRR